MLLNIAQLQAIDYILKTINIDSPKQIKLVINFNGKLLTGDFVHTHNYYYQESYLALTGLVDKRSYDPEDSQKNQALPRIWSKYVHSRYRNSLQAILSANDLSYLHHMLLELIEVSETHDAKSELRPYLYNVKAIDGSFELPFIQLSDEKLDFVSIIVTEPLA